MGTLWAQEQSSRSELSSCGPISDSAAVVTRTVERLLGQPVSEWPARVEPLYRDGNQWVIGLSRESSTRLIRGNTCRDVLRAAVLVLLVALDPASDASDEVDAALSASLDVTAPVTSPRLEFPPLLLGGGVSGRPSRVRFGIDVGLRLIAGQLPNAQIGAQVGVTLEHPDWLLSLRFTGSTDIDRLSLLGFSLDYLMLARIVGPNGFVIGPRLAVSGIVTRGITFARSAPVVVEAALTVGWRSLLSESFCLEVRVVGGVHLTRPRIEQMGRDNFEVPAAFVETNLGTTWFLD